MVGSQVRTHPALARELVAAGHELAVHADVHRPLLLRSPWGTYDDLRRAYATVSEVMGASPRWWRPTYGVPSTAALALAHTLGLTPVLWQAWGHEWDDPDPQRISRRVLASARGGGTVLLHDAIALPSGGATSEVGLRVAAALATIVPGLRARGLAVGPLNEHGLVPRTG